jgi:hypothetical protein
MPYIVEHQAIVYAFRFGSGLRGIFNGSYARTFTAFPVSAASTGFSEINCIPQRSRFYLQNTRENPIDCDFIEHWLFPDFSGERNRVVAAR